jgi:hypothetical protein
MRLKVLFVAIVANFFVTIPVGAQSKPLQYKVQCSGHEKHKYLWQSPESTKIVGEVKCGRKVIVTGPPVWHGSYAYIPVTTTDKITGYLPSDAFDEKKGPSWREAVAGAATAMDAYARTSDPHIAWCDNHGGFSQRATETENVSVTNSSTGQPIGTGTIAHTYVVCKDGTRIKEQ